MKNPPGLVKVLQCKYNHENVLKVLQVLTLLLLIYECNSRIPLQ